MKKFILLSLAALTLLNAPLARAWTYNSGDLLLIFRKGNLNVEYDLGSVSNYLGKTNGYTTTVSGWSLNFLTNSLGSITDLGNPTSVILLASGGTTNWVTSAEPNVSAYQGSLQQAQSLNGLINSVGNNPPYYISATNTAYKIDTGGVSKRASYDYIVSGNGTRTSFIGQLGGAVPFTVEQSVPGFLDFWQVGNTTVYPGSPADTLIGTFTIDANGVLKFVAGPRAPTDVSLSRTGNTNAVSFTTTVGNTYNLAYTNKLGGAVSTWPVDGTTVTGDGTVKTINHTATGPVEFYRIATQ